MRKEQGNKYFLRDQNGDHVEVEETVYKEWHRMERRERYQEEKDRAAGKISLFQPDWYGNTVASRLYWDREMVENIVIRKMYAQLLSSYLNEMSGEERRLLGLLYEDDYSVTEAAKHMGWSRKKAEYWRNKLLKRLKDSFAQDGITDY